MSQHYSIGLNMAEFVSKTGVSPSAESWGDTNSQAGLVFDIDYEDYTNDGPGHILGYSYYDPSTANGKLRRILPLRHPRNPSMWATSIGSVKFLKNTGYGSLGDSDDPISTWTTARVSVGFTTLPYTVTRDQDLSNQDESLRFVQKLTDSQTEQIEVPIGSLAYAEKPAGANWATVPYHKHQDVNKDILMWRWMKVAHTYLMTTGTDIPGNLKAARNTLNNATWNGYPPYTLLFKGYKLTPVEAPTPSANLFMPVDGPPRMWNVDLTFSYFDGRPDPGIGGGATQGWNNLPAPQLVTQYWYLAKSMASGGLPGGIPMYQSSDFTTIFKTPN